MIVKAIDIEVGDYIKDNSTGKYIEILKISEGSRIRILQDTNGKNHFLSVSISVEIEDRLRINYVSGYGGYNHEIWKGKEFICACLNRATAEWIIEAIKYHDKFPSITTTYSTFKEYLYV